MNDLISPKDLNVGDYFRNIDRKLLGKVLRITKGANSSVELSLESQDGVQRGWYFYSHEKIQLLNDDEISKFKENCEQNKEFIKVRQLYKPSSLVIGSDPEVFVVDKNNKVIPSYEFLKSRSENDLTKVDYITGFKTEQTPQPIFWDGFQAEFNVQAFQCLGWFNDSVFLGLKALSTKAKKYDKNAKLTIQSTMDIDPMILQDAKPEHVEFGCMPSLNVYGMEGIKMDGRDVPFRSAGGHIHFGFYDLANARTKQTRYIKTLDKILGVACVSLFAKYDKPDRRKMYGLAGEYRTPKHGIEYRTLSNAWLAHPLITNMVYELSRICLSVVDGNLESKWKATEEETIKCINNCDVELAREILARNKYMFTSMLFAHCRTDETAENLYKIYMLGMDSILDDASDIEGNWEVKGNFQGHCSGTGMQIGKIAENKKYDSLATEKITEIYEELVKEIAKVDEIKEAPITKKKEA